MNKILSMKKTRSISIRKLWLLYNIWENCLSETIKSGYHHMFIEFVESEKDKTIAEIMNGLY